MIALWRILWLIWRDRRAAMWRGLVLTVAVALAGIALLALSGWFIVAAGIAGLAGVGAMFDVFRPSAGVRFLAIARTAGRYGERLLTHDATLKALASLRVRVLAGLSAADFVVLARLRGGQAVNRLTADVDALDGLAIRLVFPALAGVIAAAATLVGLWFLVSSSVALWAVGVPVLGGALVLIWSGRAALIPAARAEALHQDLRAGVIDHLRGRSLLAVAGRLPAARTELLERDQTARTAAMQQAQLEWRMAAGLQAVAAITLAGTLWLAGGLAVAGKLGAAQVSLAVFATLAVAELTAAMQRGVAELGRMRDAATRVAPTLAPHPPRPVAAAEDFAPAPAGLRLSGLAAAPLPGLPPVIEGLDLEVSPGEVVALTGVSGRGKSALLNTIAGLVTPVAGQVLIGGALGYLPQRPALIAGTIRDSLLLAAPGTDDDALNAVLRACALDLPLDHRLGEGGAGLSGGQARRLALARVLIRRPDVLLLDEPTEGLDTETAAKVLHNLRLWLPDAAILIAAHRPAERQLADRVLRL